jgi:hypothetical protein
VVEVVRVIKVAIVAAAVVKAIIIIKRIKVGAVLKVKDIISRGGLVFIN